MAKAYDDLQNKLDKLLQNKVTKLMDFRVRRIMENDRDELTMTRLINAFGTEAVKRCMERYVVDADASAERLPTGPASTKVSWSQLESVLGPDVLKRIKG